MVTAPRARVARRPVHGVLLLDKPLGLSSNQALQKAKWLLCAEKAGHTGTLDPLASGVLPLCFGAATKFSQLHLDADKTYEACARLGVTTTTGDSEGTVLVQRAVQVTAQDLERVVRTFTGSVLQTPPMYSALKKDGKPLYEYARAGLEFERAPRTIQIYRLDATLELTQPAQPAIKMIVQCSKGTYIRTLAQDLGEALGCGASLTALRRIQTGPFHIGACISLAALEALPQDQRLQCLQPIESLLQDHDQITLESNEAGRFLSGLRRRGPWHDSPRVAVYGRDPRALLGTAHVQGGELVAMRLLSPIEIRQMLAH